MRTMDELFSPATNPVPYCSYVDGKWCENTRLNRAKAETPHHPGAWHGLGASPRDNARLPLRENSILREFST